jgi:hypothetical protein
MNQGTTTSEKFIVKPDGTVAPLVEQWVKMSDRKPEPGRRVIYLTKEWTEIDIGGDEEIVFDAKIYVGDYREEEFVCEMGEIYPAEYVSHWKPLPEVPDA